MPPLPSSVTPRIDRHARGDRGQAAVALVAIVATLIVVFLLGLAQLGTTVVDRTRAQTAADAAALAALDGGSDAARRLAAVHGGELVSFSIGPAADEVTVVVRIGDTTATARATDSVGP